MNAKPSRQRGRYDDTPAWLRICCMLLAMCAAAPVAHTRPNDDPLVTLASRLGDRWRVVVHLDDAASLRRLPGGAGLGGLLATPQLRGTRDAWDALARRLDLSPEQAFDQLLGRRATLALGTAPNAQGGPIGAGWLLIITVDRTTADRLRARLNPVPRATIGGRPVFALEEGRYRLVFESAPESDDRRLLLAPRESASWLEAALNPAPDAVAIVARAADTALGAGEGPSLSALLTALGPTRRVACLRARLDPERTGVRAVWSFGLAVQSDAPADALPGDPPAFVEEAIERAADALEVLSDPARDLLAWSGPVSWQIPATDLLPTSVRPPAAAIVLGPDHAGDALVCVAIPVENVPLAARAGDVVVEVLASRLAGNASMTPGFDGIFPLAPRVRRFMPNLPGTPEPWSLAWVYAGLPSGAGSSRDDGGWWVLHATRAEVSDARARLEAQRDTVLNAPTRSRVAHRGEGAGWIRPSALLERAPRLVERVPAELGDALRAMGALERISWTGPVDDAPGVRVVRGRVVTTPAPGATP